MGTYQCKWCGKPFDTATGKHYPYCSQRCKEEEKLTLLRQREERKMAEKRKEDERKATQHTPPRKERKYTPHLTKAGTSPIRMEAHSTNSSGKP